MKFYDAVCKHMQEKIGLSEQEAKAETHKLVHSYQPPI